MLKYSLKCSWFMRPKLHPTVRVWLHRYETDTDAHVLHKDNTRQFSLNIKAVHGSKDTIEALWTPQPIWSLHFRIAAFAGMIRYLRAPFGQTNFAELFQTGNCSNKDFVIGFIRRKLKLKLASVKTGSFQLDVRKELN